MAAASAADDLGERELERQVLARERVVRVERDALARHLGDADDDGLAVGLPELELLADLRVHPLGELVRAHLEHHLVAARAIGLVGGNPNGLRLARLHARHAGVEAGDDLAAAERELERLAAFGGIERGAVVEGAGVVDADGVAVGGWHRIRGVVRERKRRPPDGGRLLMKRGTGAAVPRSQSRAMKSWRTYQNISATEAKSWSEAATCRSTGKSRMIFDVS